MTPSWLPVVGEAAPNTLYLAGYNGHGLAQGPYLGTLVADVLAGECDATTISRSCGAGVLGSLLHRSSRHPP